MAADLHIHILDGVTEDEVRDFALPSCGDRMVGGVTGKSFDLLYKLVAVTPNFWIGEVSWLKAALTGDTDSYIPEPVEKVSEIVGRDFPTIDDPLIKALVGALALPNEGTGYSTCEKGEALREFLEAHKGKKVFQVSW